MEVNTKPFISVIVPVYNTEKYIDKTMQSLIKQTFKDFEVILVDDETPDNAIAVAENILSKNFINYKTVHQKNCGQGYSRNNGVKHASGKWLIFLDSDDILQPDTFELMVNVAINYEDANFVFTDFQSVLIGDEFKKALYDNGLAYFNRAEIQNSFLLRTQVILAPGTLFNAAWYINNNLGFKNIPYSEDQLFVWDTLLKVEKVVKIEKPLYNYLKRPGSIMSSTKLHAIIEGYIEFEKMQEKYLKNEEATELTKNFLLSRWVLGILHSGSKLINSNEYIDLYKSLEAKKHSKKMLTFPSQRMRIMALTVLLFPNLSYLVLKKI